MRRAPAAPVRASNAGAGATPSQQVPELGKTGTKIADLPSSVQIIPATTLAEQGVTMLRDSVYNASGVNFGGQDSKGYFDHFLIRGLNAQIYSDGFSDGDQLGGLSHSLNGVKQIEILEGPGSALFGSGPPWRHDQRRSFPAGFRLPLRRQRAGRLVRNRHES